MFGCELLNFRQFPNSSWWQNNGREVESIPAPPFGWKCRQALSPFRVSLSFLSGVRAFQEEGRTGPSFDNSNSTAWDLSLFAAKTQHGEDGLRHDLGATHSWSGSVVSPPADFFSSEFR